jgi:hypothetical protein
MSNIADLKTELQTIAGTITITMERLYALDLIDRWYSARLAADTTNSSGVISYSIGGRSVTRQGVSQSKTAEMLWAELISVPEIAAAMRLRGGGLADCRGTLTGADMGVML